MIEVIIICVTGVMALWIALSFKSKEKKSERREEQRSLCVQDKHDFEWEKSLRFTVKSTGGPLAEGTCTGCGFVAFRKMDIIEG